MDSRPLFIVGVRLFGIWELLRCIDYVLEWCDMKADFYRSSLSTVGVTYTHMLVYLIVGLYLLCEAPRIARFFYPTAAPASEANPSSPPAA